MRGSRFFVLLMVGWLGVVASARTAAADVTANPTTHDYGNQQIGVADTPLTVALNNGPGGIMVTVPATACGGAVAITPNGVRTIASNGNDSLSFVFTPIDRNALNNCVVTLDADSGTDPTITLNGDGVASDLNITAGSIAFNNQRHNGGTPETRTLTIQNTGEVAITAAQLSAVLSNTTDFSIGALSGTIPAGGSATLPVTFNPAAVGPKTGTLTITASNDFPDDTIVINLTGTGTQSVVNDPGRPRLRPGPGGDRRHRDAHGSVTPATRRPTSRRSSISGRQRHAVPLHRQRLHWPDLQHGHPVDPGQRVSRSWCWRASTAPARPSPRP
jgi:hypothetical protein